MAKENMDGYRYFFPAGWAFGVWGVLLWLLFPWNLVRYPGLAHPEIMTGGFFLCFVCGFLMTAAPRFTGTYGPTKGEQSSSFSLIAALFLSLIPSDKVYFYGVVTGLYIFLLMYLTRRFLQRKASLPDSFLFVGVGVGIGLFGSVVLLLAQVMDVPVILNQLARLLFMQGYVLCLVMGVGSRLIPALLGWVAMPSQTMEVAKSLKPHFAVLAILFVGSYVLEAIAWVLTAQLLRAIVMSIIVFYFWRIQKFPVRRAFQSWWLWTSAWFMLIGQWGTVFFLHFRVHLLHIIMVSGLGLMTLMIAVRVSLSHGQHGTDMEKSSRSLCLGALLICFSGLTRWSAGLAPAIYQSHLLYAAGTWLLGLLVWGWLFLPKIVRAKTR